MYVHTLYMNTDEITEAHHGPVALHISSPRCFTVAFSTLVYAVIG